MLLVILINALLGLFIILINSHLNDFDNKKQQHTKSTAMIGFGSAVVFISMVLAFLTFRNKQKVSSFNFGG